MNLKLTAEGKKALLRGLTGEQIKFTKIVLGNGQAQAAENATALANPLLTLTIDSKTVSDGFVTLCAKFTNSDITDGFHATEIGCFIENSESGKEDVLYAIGYEDEGTADYIPSVTDRLLEMQLDVMAFVGDSENVSAVISGSIVYVSAAQFDTHLSAENPHGVTAAQVGLGNVPNVTTNNQTPTYVETDTLTALTNGEKLSVAFSKIAAAVKAFLSHKGSRSNPHEVTADQIGAAKKAHTHSANDINSGVLNVARGGTGVSSLEALRSTILFGASDTLFQYGSYVGDGESGAAHPTSISCRTTPKMLLVMPKDLDRSTASANGGFVALAGVDRILGGGLAYGDSANSEYRSFTWSADTVSWYASTATRQLNENGKTYYYLIIY